MPMPLIALIGLLIFATLSDGGDDPDPAVASGPCSISNGSSTADPGRPRCDTVASDTGSEEDPIGFWGRIDCANASRHRRITRGGDPHSTASGDAQGDRAFRRLSILDADETAYAVGRCELGYNWNDDRDPGTGLEGPGPTVFYREGERRITFASVRLPPTSDPGDPDWRVVLQMKQTQPYNNLRGGSMLELQARDGRWLVISDWNDVWSAPAEADRWTRFAFDVTYSSDPAEGSLQIHVDLNGDGDTGDDGERSPRFALATLRAETPGKQDTIPPGKAIPSHLRAGLYQNRNYSCPPPSGCWVDVDNVQVVTSN